jgi:hypothetical protein
LIVWVPIEIRAAPTTFMVGSTTAVCPESITIHPFYIFRSGSEDLSQDLFSSLEFQGPCIRWLDMVVHEQNLLFRPDKLLEDPCHT